MVFRNKGVDNKINIIVDRFNQLGDLRGSNESNGLVLYGDYVSSEMRGRKYLIIFWDKIGKNRGAFLNKIYGFRIGDRKYEGLLTKEGGRRIGKSAIMIAVGTRKEIFDLIKKYKVNAKVLERTLKNCVFQGEISRTN